MKRDALITRPMRPRSRTCSLAALVVAMCVVGRSEAQMSGDSWSTDPTMAALNPGQAAFFRSGADFPLPTYSAIGATLARNGHFVELGWNSEQVKAFLEGMNAAFQGKPLPIDEKAQQLLAEIARRVSSQGQAGANAVQTTGLAVGPDFPPSSFSAMGSFLAVSGHFPELGWNDAQTKAFEEGMRAALEGKAIPFDDNARRLLSDIGRQIIDIEALRKVDMPATQDEAGRLAWYMKKIRNRLGLQQSNSGLAFRVERGRGGVRPRPGDTIVLTCSASDANGTTKLQQISGERIRIKMENLLPGLMEGLQMMSIDASAVFVLPPKLSFGDNPWPIGVQRGAPIIFNVALHDVIAASPPP